MGRHLSPQYGQVILVSGYPVLTAVNWSQHWCTICVQYQSSCATKLARKWEIEHWFSCGADIQVGCGRCTVTWLPNVLGWVDLLTHGAPQVRFVRQSSTINDLPNCLSNCIAMDVRWWHPYYIREHQYSQYSDKFKQRFPKKMFTIG